MPMKSKLQLAFSIFVGFVSSFSLSPVAAWAHPNLAIFQQSIRVLVGTCWVFGKASWIVLCAGGKVGLPGDQQGPRFNLVNDPRPVCL
jgi:hypothetical protein